MPHLEDIKNRIYNIEQIEGVIVAMRAMAAAHAREARRHLKAIRAHEETVARSMAEALSLMPGAESPATSDSGPGRLIIVVGAAQGFSGLYNDRIIDGALENETGDGHAELLLIGQRCIAGFAERGRGPVWSANMVAHAAEVPSLASRIVDALFARVESAAVDRVDIIHADPATAATGLTVRQLIPFDYSRVGVSERRNPPLTLIEPALLVARLVEEYVFAEICDALMLGFAAENEARMNAMTQARANVQRMGQDLHREYNQARQEETTTEIIELSASAGQGCQRLG